VEPSLQFCTGIVYLEKSPLESSPILMPFCFLAHDVPFGWLSLRWESISQKILKPSFYISLWYCHWHIQCHFDPRSSACNRLLLFASRIFSVSPTSHNAIIMYLGCICLWEEVGYWVPSVSKFIAFTAENCFLCHFFNNFLLCGGYLKSWTSIYHLIQQYHSWGYTQKTVTPEAPAHPCLLRHYSQ
jgi:hypothetical protein